MRGHRSALSIVGIIAGSMCASAQGSGGMSMGGGMMGMSHDSSTRAQMQVIHELIVNNALISRTVTNLPNGIRSVTSSNDPRLARLIKEHVLTMDRRLRRGDDPRLPMESPALQALFRGKDEILTTIDTTATGATVIQTSRDSAIVVALQRHAAEVTELVNRGMDAMHEAMMRNMPKSRTLPKNNRPPSD